MVNKDTLAVHCTGLTKTYGSGSSQVHALSVCIEIMIRFITVWSQCMIITDRRQTDRRHHSNNTDSLASQS